MKDYSFKLIAASILLSLSCTAWSEMVVIVNNSNPSSSLSAEQVARIFLGKTNSFPDGAASIPIDLPKGDFRDGFYSKVTGKNRGQVNAYWSQQIFTGAGQPPKEVATEEEVVNLVANNPNIIGYVDKAKANANVKVVLTVP